jgi:hypothetical protein
MASEQKLIYANKLYEKATRAWGHTLCDGCYSEIIDLIDEAPTVDAVPVAQGRVTDIKAKMSEILRHGDCPFIFRESESEQLADYLYTKGMTVQHLSNPDVGRWIPLTEKLPELIPCSAGTGYSEVVNVLTDGRKVLTAIWDGTEFIADADFWDAEGEKITHWTPVLLPLPEPSAEGE